MAFNDNTHTSTTGAHGTNVGADHKPTVGEKISGTMDKITGKITNNPAKVAEGEAKKRGDTVAAEQADHAANAHKSIGNNAGTGHGTHTGTGAYEGSGHHTGAATGAGLGATGAGVGSGLGHDHSHSHTGTHTGTGTGTGTGLGHKAPGEPTMGDKVAGNTQAAAGRMTNDPVQYAQGQERKTDTSYGAGATGAGLGSGMGHTGPTGTHTGTGLTGSHGAHNTGTGLTGSHGAHNTGTGLTGSHGTHNTGTGLTGSHNTHSTGAGLTGSHNTHGTGYDNHNHNNHNNNATMGEKLSGGMDKMVGKATNDPVRVAEGEAKSQGHNIPNQHSATGGIGGHNAGQTYTGAPGTNTGAPY